MLLGKNIIAASIEEKVLPEKLGKYAKNAIRSCCALDDMEEDETLDVLPWQGKQEFRCE